VFLSKDPFNVIIGELGDRGMSWHLKFLGEMLVSQGYVITIGETLWCLTAWRCGDEPSADLCQRPISPLIPEGQCDLLVSLEPVEGLRILDTYGNPG